MTDTLPTGTTYVSGVDGNGTTIKTDAVDIKGQLGRMERSNEAFQRRTDARFEQLITYIERDETKGS